MTGGLYCFFDHGGSKSAACSDLNPLDVDLNLFKTKSNGMVILLKRHKNVIILSVKHG